VTQVVIAINKSQQHDFTYNERHSFQNVLDFAPLRNIGQSRQKSTIHRKLIAVQNKNKEYSIIPTRMTRHNPDSRSASMDGVTAHTAL
jgi:hypothetical protein